MRAAHDGMPATCSIIVPARDEERGIERILRLARERAPHAELIVVDGKSTDETVARASSYARVISAPAGRGAQLNAGARASHGDVLLFLHADTTLDPGGIDEMLGALGDPAVQGGAFRLRFDDSRPAFATLADMITHRSLQTRSYTGDQAIFVRRGTFFALGGCRPWRFMEDVELSERLARHGKSVLLDAAVETSARRHRRWGLARTQATVMLIRALYLARIPPDRYADLWPDVRE